jgi:hypothetical protein
MSNRSNKKATRPVSLEVHIQSQQLPPASDLTRSWLVTLRVSLDGEAAALGQLADSCDISSSAGQEDGTVVTYLGQPDDFSALYQLTKASNQGGNNLASPIRVQLTPRYHPAASAVYRLDKRLAAMVGRNYLAHPKYALSVLLAYARSHCIVTPKSIMCDRKLTELLGRPWVRHQAVWSRLSGLMTRVTADTVSLEHNLAGNDDATATSTAVMELSVDSRQNLYPARWIHNGLQTHVLERSRTEGDISPAAAAAAVAKAGMVVVKGGKKTSLKRHQSI